MSTHTFFLILSVFLISIVESIEMATIVIAVGRFRGWFPTLLGGGVGLGLLAGLILVFGSLLSRIPLDPLRALIGILLLLFGIQWLRKSIYRVSEDGLWSGEEEEEEDEEAEQGDQSFLGLDWHAFARGFQGVFLEGLEIAFVVVTFGSAANHIGWAAIAAVAALLIIGGIAIAARDLLTEIPGNSLKFAVGILLCTYGTYWSAVGMGAHWPGGDYGVIGVLAFYILLAFLAIYVVRQYRTN